MTIGTREFIIPGLQVPRSSISWLERQRLLASAGAATADGFDGVLQTVALGAEAVMDASFIDRIVDSSESWPVSGVYVVAAHPDDQPIVTDPIWLTNLMLLVAGFRLSGKRVVLGYANQQQLLCGCAAVDTICSGTWLNVRAFGIDKFYETEEADPRQRGQWCYSALALSEYRAASIQVAARTGALDLLVPRSGGYQTLRELVDAGQFASITERELFRHYLITLAEQASAVARGTFAETVESLRGMLSTAEDTISELRASAIRPSYRALSGAAIDASVTALDLFEREAGPTMARAWGALTA
ncbi:MAG: hypothetical protein CVU23_14330 [Betaproteobacteria bacterium HGW-Betaproteobacteria-17]|nr:MAG: hypothetical protein CVU23_14330 [Betaproteobacteria bacterium HGW-Betaproteobacteria-17]